MGRFSVSPQSARCFGIPSQDDAVDLVHPVADMIADTGTL
jgi:hypothetical protein